MQTSNIVENPMKFPEVHQVEGLGFQEQLHEDALNGNEVLLVGLGGSQRAYNYRAGILDRKVFGGFVPRVDGDRIAGISKAFADALHGITIRVNKTDEFGKEVVAVCLDLLCGPAGEIEQGKLCLQGVDQ